MIDTDSREANIVTPEHVQLQLRTAGLGSRTAAQLLDLLVLAVLFAAVSLVVGIVLMVVGTGVAKALGDYAAALLIVLGFLLTGGYFAISEYYMGGQTWGKRRLGLRVVLENGQPLTWLASIIRNFFRLIDFLPSFYFLGTVWIFLHKKDKRLGDVAAGTIVVQDMRWDKLTQRRRMERWLQKWRAEERPELILTDSMRRRFEREDWIVLSSFVERLPSLLPAKRQQFAETIAAKLAHKLELEQSLYEAAPTGFLIALYEQFSEEWTL
ncbi:RDD family protein [Paenibacillus sp. YYML68]|uniref:RDD family protein n=1 Tax=Paenibacillus sp. YYML68 TaxID=2909250 RepID=UPI002493C50C|nr:RDD family protein [Paenibacillus sp. YYML68]